MAVCGVSLIQRWKIYAMDLSRVMAALSQTGSTLKQWLRSFQRMKTPHNYSCKLLLNGWKLLKFGTRETLSVLRFGTHSKNYSISNELLTLYISKHLKVSGTNLNPS